MLADHAPPATGSARPDQRVLVLATFTLASAMGIGRFVYTPILPLMQAQAGLSAVDGAHLATANYLGYFVGAVLLSVLPRWARSNLLARGSLLFVVASLAAMPVVHNVAVWSSLRFLAGVASAVMFIVSAQAVARVYPAYRAGWAFGGVGLGIALSGIAVLALTSTASWPMSWYSSAALALVLGIGVWNLAGVAAKPVSPAPAAEGSRGTGRLLGLLLAGYFLEGVGYIIAATFLVTALAGSAVDVIGNGAWILVGLAAIPSCVLWTRWSRRIRRSTLLVLALMLQAVAIALPAMTGSTLAVLGAAIIFGGTFMGVVSLAMAAGADLGIRRAAPMLTACYGLGQIAGPLLVQPTLNHGYTAALLIGGGVALLGALSFLAFRVTEPAGQVSSKP